MYETNISTKEMECKLAFYEKKMNDRSIDPHWRMKAEYMYWYYLELLTKPNKD